MLLVSPSHKFHSISLYDKLFSSYRLFWEKCTKWLQKRLDTTWSKVHSICYKCPLVPNCSPFRSTTRNFGVLGHFEANTPNNPPPQKKKWTWTLHGQGIPYKCYSSPRVPNFSPFPSTTSRFQVMGHFQTWSKVPPYTCYYSPWKVSGKCTNDHKWPWTIQDQRYPHICVISLPESQILVRFPLRPVIFKSQAILRQVHWITPK